MSSKFLLAVGGLSTYAAATFVGYNYIQSQKPSPCNGGADSDNPRNIKIDDSKRIASFNKHAKSYDDEIGRDEFFMGMNLLRRWHLRKARGKLLEVGCGTGRNFDYYGSSVEEIVAVDAAENMVVNAKSKISPQQQHRIAVKQMNAHQLIFENDSFDTVVDTFGLCSYQDPIAVLRELQRVCRSDGTILLIEHGRGSYEWINNILDNGACQHANNWGCIWNRDILDLIAKAGLQVISVNRWHFGTTYLIEVKPIATSKHA